MFLQLFKLNMTIRFLELRNAFEGTEVKVGVYFLFLHGLILDGSIQHVTHVQTKTSNSISSRNWLILKAVSIQIFFFRKGLIFCTQVLLGLSYLLRKVPCTSLSIQIGCIVQLYLNILISTSNEVTNYFYFDSNNYFFDSLMYFILILRTF